MRSTPTVEMYYAERYDINERFYRSIKSDPLGNLAMDGETVWNTSWAWSIPLIVLTVIIHVIGLGLFNVKMVQILTEARGRRDFMFRICAWHRRHGHLGDLVTRTSKPAFGQRRIGFWEQRLMVKQRYFS